MTSPDLRKIFALRDYCDAERACPPPSFPSSRSPNDEPAERSIIAAQVQKAARYPVINASGDSLSGNSDALMTALETTATRLIPSDVPNCDTVLNTPPARACISAGKTSVMTMWAMVNKTM